MGRLWLVKGESMSPSFRSGELLLVGAAAYRGAAAGRGNVVIVGDPRGTGEHYLKRVVGLPGEEVRLADGMLFIDGVHLPEPYLGGLPSVVGLDCSRWRLSGGEYFVLSDNRAHGTDSRDFGPIGRKLIIGRVRFRVWPPCRWGRAAGG